MQIAQNAYQRESAKEQRRKYNGVELNDITKTYEMDFRGYDPALGRFMQVDPLADIIPAINPYSFGYNNPVFFSDPLGLIGEGDDDRKNRRKERKRARKNRREQRRAKRKNRELDEFGGRRDRNKNDDSKQHADPDPLFLGNKLDEIIIIGDRMSGLEAMRFDSDSNPIVRAARSGVTPRGRKISFGEGLGFETDFMKSVNAVKGGFFAAFTGIVSAPFVGSTLGTAALDGSAVYSAASLEFQAISIYGHGWATSLANSGVGYIGGLLSSSAVALKLSFGPMRQWIRLGPSYSQHLGRNISLSIRWGASPTGNWKYVNQIGNANLRLLNQSLRMWRIPIPNWRFRDPGHLHLKK